MHNIIAHQIAKVEIPNDEKDRVVSIIQQTNQFIADNYSGDDPAAYFSITSHGFALVPIRTDIVGVFISRAKMTHESMFDIAGFIANLRRAMNANGYDFPSLVRAGIRP